MTSTNLRLGVLALCVLGSASAGCGWAPGTVLAIIGLGWIAWDVVGSAERWHDEAQWWERNAGEWADSYERMLDEEDDDDGEG